MSDPARQFYDTLAAEAAALEPKHFARFHRGFFLVGEFPEARTQPKAFQTQVVPLMDGTAAALQSAHFACAIRKSKDSVWTNRMSVGRTTNSDIMIRHPSVSKLHAQFYWRDPHNPEAGLLVADVGSANGTWVNDWQLAIDERVDVGAGDEIRFGSVRCLVADAARLHAELRAAR